MCQIANHVFNSYICYPTNHDHHYRGQCKTTLLTHSLPPTVRFTLNNLSFTLLANYATLQSKEDNQGDKISQAEATKEEDIRSVLAFLFLYDWFCWWVDGKCKLGEQRFFSCSIDTWWEWWNHRWVVSAICLSLLVFFDLKFLWQNCSMIFRC